MDDPAPADEVRRTLHAYCRRLDERDLNALLDEVYLPDLVRTPAGWRISRREVSALGPDGLAAGRLPEVFAGFGGAR